jgi:hypothetical protein
MERNSFKIPGSYKLSHWGAFHKNHRHLANHRGHVTYGILSNMDKKYLTNNKNFICIFTSKATISMRQLLQNSHVPKNTTCRTPMTNFHPETSINTERMSISSVSRFSFKFTLVRLLPVKLPHRISYNSDTRSQADENVDCMTNGHIIHKRRHFF